MLTSYRVLLLLLTVTACYGDASSDLAKLQTDYFSWRMSERPWQATANKIYTYNDQLRSDTLENFNISKAKADDFYQKLMNISEDKLDSSGKLNYRMLKDMLTTFRDGYKWRKYTSLTPVNFLDGPQFLPSTILDVQPFVTRGDFENYLARLEKIPKQCSEYKTLMREAIRLNRTNHMASMSRLEGQFQQLNVTDPTHSEFYKPFNDTLDKSKMQGQFKQSYRDRAKSVVTDVVQAFNDLWSFIKQEYLPNTRPSIGIGSLDRGKEFYSACIRWYLSVDMTAQEIHDIGLSEVDRIVKEMQKIMTKQGYNGSVGQYFQSLLSDSRFTFNTGGEKLAEYRNLIKIISKKLPTLFMNTPGLPIEVRPLPYDGPEGYSQGTPDGSRPGVFWANTFRPEKSVNFTTVALTLHEADPGHHMQLSFAMTVGNPDFRQKMEFSNLYEVPFAFPSYTSYIEGWGLYAESLGEAMGVYRDDYDLIGRYSFEMLRACRLVVDTGMHVLGWTRDKAITYLQNHLAEPLDTIKVEIDRYITWPGQALSYKIGEIKIRQLRDKAKKELGAKFDIRKFHSVVLESGTVPLSILEELVNQWIADSQTTVTKPPCVTSGYTVITSSCIWTLVIFFIVSSVHP